MGTVAWQGLNEAEVGEEDAQQGRWLALSFRPKHISRVPSQPGMADPLSVTAGIVGITAVALHSFRKLEEFIGKIKDAPPAVAAIKTDLQNMVAVLTTLQNTLENSTLMCSESKALLQDLRVEAAIKSCGHVCSRFEATLAHWMRHSTEGKIHWWDRVKVGYFGEAKLRAFILELQTCKATISLALEAANFMNGCRQVSQTEQMKALMLPALTSKEDDLRRKVPAIDNQIYEVDSQLKQLCIMDNTQLSHDVDLEESRIGLVAEVEQYRSLLEGYRAFCTEAAREIHCERTGQKIERVVADGGDLLVGVINVEHQGRIKQDIRDVEARRGGRAVVGVANIDTTGLFTRNWRPF